VLYHAALNLADFEDQAAKLADAGQPGLAARIEDLAARSRAVHAIQLGVHDVVGKTARSMSIGPSGTPLRDEIRAQQAEFAQLSGRIAKLASAADQNAALAAMLASAAAAGPLCYLVHLPVGDDGLGPDLPGLAVIVSARSPDSVTIRTVTLPGLTGPAVRRWLEIWPPGPASLTSPGTRTLLRELGEVVLGPVIAAAGHPERLVLLPDGFLSILPLHAAEIITGPDGTAGPVISKHIVSYVPSARILRACQIRVAKIAGNDHDRLPRRFLGITYPGDDHDVTGTVPDLPYSQREVSKAATFFAERRFLSGRDASVAGVQSALVADDAVGLASVVHFACHAQAVPGDPLSSYLALGPSGDQDRLQLADLLGLGLRQIRLAVLSACKTGQRGSRDPDQYVSLATGFLQIGAAGVIGTTAEVGDMMAQTLMTRFYEEWQTRPADPAAALAAAQAWLASTGRQPEGWAPFFYTGT
jgi:CHAT domain